MNIDVLFASRIDIENILVMPAEAGIQRLKSLDYEIHPCISSCGPAIGCSNLLLADLVRPKTCRNDGCVGYKWVFAELIQPESWSDGA
jgi:hypothetical protein